MGTGRLHNKTFDGERSTDSVFHRHYHYFAQAVILRRVVLLTTLVMEMESIAQF